MQWLLLIIIIITGGCPLTHKKQSPPSIHKRAIILKTRRESLKSSPPYSPLYPEEKEPILKKGCKRLMPLFISKVEKKSQIDLKAGRNNALLVWVNKSLLNTSYEIYGAKIEASLKDHKPFLIVKSRKALMEPYLSWNGKEYGLVYSKQGYIVQFLKFKDDLSLLNSPITVVSESGYARFPTLTWNGKGYALIWNAQDLQPQIDFFHIAIHFISLTKEGKAISAKTCLGEHRPTGRPQLIWTGKEYLALWNVSFDRQYATFYFSRINPGGKMQEVSRLTRKRSEFVLNDPSPSFLWVKPQAITSWVKEGEVKLVRIPKQDPTSFLVTTASKFKDPSPRSPRIIWNGKEYGIIWLEKTEKNTWSVQFRRLDKLGNLKDHPIQIAEDVNPEITPCLIQWKNGFLVAYAKNQNSIFSHLQVVPIQCPKIETNDKFSS
jgi:hypothetical protein